MLSIFWNLFAVGIKWVFGLFASQAFRSFLWSAIVGVILRFFGFLGFTYLSFAILTPIFDLFLAYVEDGFRGIIVGGWTSGIFDVVEYLGFIAGIKMLLGAYVFRFTYRTMLSFVPPVSKAANVNYS